ncbi:DUF465 domain-containing protein [Pseudomonas putida]|uniref:DUF465 domain-containing protein n=1 Tax=Pseudomonas putida TaxID=303 RepID=A0A2Z4RGQ7_PSEPU|nr:DUF465 domain-containing protein [Pseudomonas putida]AWY39508.1 DUF465 domain-containing protein [Pseudomonas putida]
MPVSHDLFKDLNRTREEIQKRRAEDPLLDSLINKYSQADKAVVEAEEAKSSDDAVTRLKAKRLEVKDKIVRQLQSPS